MTILKRIWERICWKRRTLCWHHKWLGIVLCLLLLCFCLSGIVLTLFIALTGWMLRPPMLLLIAGKEFKSPIEHDNPWEDNNKRVIWNKTKRRTFTVTLRRQG